MATKKAVASVKHSTVAAKTSNTKASSVKAVSSNRKTWLSGSPLSRAPFVGALVAEFVGTFLLASTIITGQGQPIIILFAFAGIALLVGALSGAHLNPAISIAAWATRRVTGLRALGYIGAQFLGAGLAFAVLNAFVGGAAPVDAQAQAFGQQAAASLFHATALPAGKEWYIFFAELLGTTILGFALANALRERKDRVASALTGGLGIFVALLVAASAAAYVGGSAILNPAAALSLQALKWELWPLAVYVLAPVIGGIVGFILNDVLQAENDGGRDRLVG
ncbi:aquaporin [Candidatus Saccharibacteria bacterium]|nr:aquaporin [Candidatus Saccharibacteria bacterium]